MKKDIKKLWVEDLRSGEFKQGRGTLRDIDNKFCCLGVLANRWGKWEKNNFSSTYFNFIYDSYKDASGLPMEFLVFIKLIYDDHLKLIELNDVKLKSFAEIADWIEQNL